MEVEIKFNYLISRNLYNTLKYTLNRWGDISSRLFPGFGNYFRKVWSSKE